MKANVALGDAKIEFEADRPTPTLQSGEVLIKVAASPIQPSDFMNISGGLPVTKFPIVPGRDYAGVVVEPSSSSWHKKRVFGTSGPELSLTRDGTHAEYVVVPEHGLAEIPEKLNMLEASMIGVPWTTAWMSLERARASPGETILIIGASGKVGSAAVELAKSQLWKCKVLTAGRGDKYDVDVTKSPDLSQAKELTDGKGPDIILDAAGDVKLAAAALGVLKQRGRLALITTGAAKGPPESEISVDLKALYRAEHIIVGSNSFQHTLGENAIYMSKIAAGFESGAISPPKVDGPKITKIGVDGVKEAYASIGKGSRQTYLIDMEDK